MLNNFKITGKLTIGFGIVLALFGVAVFFSWTSISAVQQDVRHLQNVAGGTVKIANELNLTVSWIRAGIRDLRYSESDEDMEKLAGYVNTLRTSIEKGKRLYSENPRLISLSENLPQMENILRNSETTMNRTFQMIRTKRTVSETLVKEIDKMIALLDSVIDMQYKITIQNLKTNLEGHDYETDINRIRAVEALQLAFCNTARYYAQAMWYRNAK
ncbi:MAG: MCP four helix bundle domain-containing protein, partial [Synergistaceae bacterium]|nr:MCP four helix bundle domain-containing protein [Synergistaceae bacterium]